MLFVLHLISPEQSREGMNMFHLSQKPFQHPQAGAASQLTCCHFSRVRCGAKQSSAFVLERNDLSLNFERTVQQSHAVCLRGVIETIAIKVQAESQEAMNNHSFLAQWRPFFPFWGQGFSLNSTGQKRMPFFCPWPLGI